MILDKDDIETANEMAKTLQQSKNDELIVVGNLLAFLLKEREALANHIVDANKMVTQQEGQSNYCLQCEALSRELVALKTQQSNEQVEPVAWTDKAFERLCENWNHMTSEEFAIVQRFIFGVYAHPPVPTAQPERCQLCNYQYGHSIGCKNNPVDIAIEAMAQPKELVAIMPSNTRYTVEVEGHGQTYWDNIHDAITNAQRAVYSGVDNTTRALDDLKAGRIAEWSYGFSAVRIYPPQNTTPPQRKPLSEAAIEGLAKFVAIDDFNYDFARAIEKAHGIKGD